MAQQHETFEAFWPAYLAQRRRPEVRGLQLFGAGFTILLVAKAIVDSAPAWLLGAVISPFFYPAAGIAVFQRETPSLFTSPQWTLRADLKFFGLYFTGKLPKEYKRLGLI